VREEGRRRSLLPAFSTAHRRYISHPSPRNKLYKDEGGRYNFGAVRRWGLPPALARAGQASTSVLDVDLLVAPVHQGMHWVCAVADLKGRRLLYYDSLKARAP